MSDTPEKASSCDITAKSTCCSSEPSSKVEKDYKEHWNKAYSNSPMEKLGWFETDLTPSLDLIKKTGLATSAHILNVGSGSTILIDALLELNYHNLIATDISDVALNELRNRINKDDKVEFIQDDLTKPDKLRDVDSVDLWIDRAVLHFFNDIEDQKTYFDLVKSKIKVDGFVILAEFSIEGAAKCSGLDVFRYSKEMLAVHLGEDFELIEHFDYTYSMPSGDPRPYIYTLFKRIA